VTNVNFIFEISPNLKSEGEKVEAWHIISPAFEKNGGTRLLCLPRNCAHASMSIPSLQVVASQQRQALACGMKV